MVFLALSLDGTRKSAVQLELDIIYRIGRRLGLEFHIDDESVELAHATITHIAGGIVRLSAVAGKMYVNGQEIEIKSISNSDIVNGLVDLRFGNVNAKLYFNDARLLDNEAAHDSSGYEEGNKEKSSNITGDSLIIPETRPPSADTTDDEESFNIPETQAISFTRYSKGYKESNVSFGDDFLIPETQDVLAQGNQPVGAHQDHDIISEDDASELGTQIRICTQEFNEFNEDAIDDFDSSLLLGEGGLAMCGRDGPKLTADNIEDEHNMSALNCSISNSKYTALNSTQAVEVSPRREICLTPDLSAGQRLNALDNVPCTPDLFDLLEVDANQSSGSRTAELINVNVDVHSSSSNRNAVDTHNLCRTDKLLVASVETPETTPPDPEDFQDYILTQVFPIQKTCERAGNTQDLIATQAFDKANMQPSCNSSADIEDFIETQAFAKRNSFLAPQLKSKVSSNSSENENNEDFIETQAFPLRKSFLGPKCSEMCDNSQDLIATQAFISHSQSSKIIPNGTDTILNTTEDLRETQLFVNHKNTGKLQISDSISIGDEIDQELKQLIELSSMPSSPSDDEADNNIIKSSCIIDKTQVNKICQSKELENELGKIVAHASLGHKRSRKLSEQPISVKIITPKLATKANRKRSVQPSGELITPPKSMRLENPKNIESVDIEGTNDQHKPPVARKSRSQTSVPLVEDRVTSMESIKETNDDSKFANKLRECKVKKPRNSNDDNSTVISLEQQPVIQRPRRKGTKKTNDINNEGCGSTKALDMISIDKDSCKKTSNTEVPGRSKSEKITGKSKGEATGITKLTSQKSLAMLIEEQPNGASRRKLSKQDTLQDINDYIKKIKSSGRKIQLSLSMCNYTELRTLLSSLKNVVDVTENPLCCDLLIMDKGERTYKFLVGIASNKPILSTRWLHAIKETRSIAVKPIHIFKDEKFQDLFKFDPLSVMKHPSLLKGLHFMVGNSIQPNIKDMTEIIKCAGGTVHNKPPPIASNVRLYVVACQTDKYIFKLLRNYTNLQYIKSEGVMQTLVQHKPELLEEYKLKFE